MKIAIVHDYLTQYGGAERVLETLSSIYPNAPIFTSIFDEEKLTKQGFSIPATRITTSFMQKMPLKRTWAQSYYFPFYPLAFENFKFDNYDVVISNNSYASKGIITKPETFHLCYCCTPTRHLWLFDDYAKHHSQIKKPQKLVLRPLISYLRMWDYAAAQRVDSFVAISTIVQDRIHRFYRRKSRVLFPPVNTEKFQKDYPKPKEDSYFLIVSRLGGHKRVDIAIEAFNELPDLTLVIIGDGPMRKKYEKLANKNILFKGRLSDEKTNGYFQHCLAFLYPQEEDFGITAVEAQAAGKPVIGYAKGGVIDTVINGETGILFEKQTPSDLKRAIKQFQNSKLNKIECQKNAFKFSENKFKEKFQQLVESEFRIYKQKMQYTQSGGESEGF